jgi:hypothetical protein
MRHFRRRYLVLLPLPMATLGLCVQATGSEFATVSHPRASNRITSLENPANPAESLPSVAATAQPKLHMTPTTDREPILFRRHRAPCRRFLDTELRT